MKKISRALIALSLACCFMVGTGCGVQDVGEDELGQEEIVSVEELEDGSTNTQTCYTSKTGTKCVTALCPPGTFYYNGRCIG